MFVCACGASSMRLVFEWVCCLCSRGCAGLLPRFLLKGAGARLRISGCRCCAHESRIVRCALYVRVCFWRGVVCDRGGDDITWRFVLNDRSPVSFVGLPMCFAFSGRTKPRKRKVRTRGVLFVFRNHTPFYSHPVYRVPSSPGNGFGY